MYICIGRGGGFLLSSFSFNVFLSVACSGQQKRTSVSFLILVYCYYYYHYYSPTVSNTPSFSILLRPHRKNNISVFFPNAKTSEETE